MYSESINLESVQPFYLFSPDSGILSGEELEAIEKRGVLKLWICRLQNNSNEALNVERENTVRRDR